jgi:hypothetical protein
MSLCAIFAPKFAPCSRHELRQNRDTYRDKLATELATNWQHWLILIPGRQPPAS